MGFWQDFRAGYRSGHGREPEPPFRTPRAPPAWRSAPAACPGCEGKEAALRERETEIEECKSVIQELAAEVERLAAELKAVSRNEGGRSGFEAKYKRLKIALAKHLHPDVAGTNKALFATLERIFKDLRAEIDRIEYG